MSTEHFYRPGDVPYQEFSWKVAQKRGSQLLLRFYDGVLCKTQNERAEPVLILGVGTDRGFTYERGRELLQRCSVRLREPSDGAIIWSSNRPAVSPPINAVGNKALTSGSCGITPSHANSSRCEVALLTVTADLGKSQAPRPVRYHSYGRAKQQPAYLLSLDASRVPRCSAVKF